MINFPELTLPICSYARIELHEKKKKNLFFFKYLTLDTYTCIKNSLKVLKT